jgi:predicted acetyltransferase
VNPFRTVDIPETRKPELLRLNTWAFPGPLSVEALLELPCSLPFDRARGVVTDDDELVAFHASYGYRQFPVPGARTSVSGLTWVGVHPGHRRRGLLRSMIADHFARSLARGEAISALWAAEMAIYGRFGYGLAARDLRLTVPRTAALRDVAGVERLEVEIAEVGPAHAEVIQLVHAPIDRPGWATRETDALLAAFLSDPEPAREGAESLRIAVVRDGGAPVGYALFRRKMSWEEQGPNGVVRVREAVAPTAAVAHRLWSVLLDLDLMGSVEIWPLAVDDPLLHLLVDPRAARPRLGDNVWIRILDVAGALGARRYATAVDVVLELTDSDLADNAGRWRLEGGPDGARVERTDSEPDLRLDIRELGAVYLGGESLLALVRAGLVTELRPGAAHRAAVAFGWPVAPVCSWVF